MTIYENYIKRLNELGKNYFVESAGESFLGEPIYAVKPKGTKPKVLMTAAIHAREYVTTFMLIKFIEKFSDYPVEYVPMANPDGVRLCTERADYYKTIKDKLDDKVRAVIERSDLNLWKANLRGVDLNVNFDAGWGKGAKNKTTIGSENYIGERPFSETESRVLKRLSLDKTLVLCYHSLGEEIYYGYNNEVGKDLAIALSKENGYAAKTAAFSHGGHKDWFIASGLGKGLTIEVGSERLSHPIGIGWANSLAAQNEGIFKVLKKFGYV